MSTDLANTSRQIKGTSRNVECTARPTPWEAFGQKKKKLLGMACSHMDSSAPPLHADLLLADHRRGPRQPAARLDSLWQRLRLLVVKQLWDAYCRARLQQRFSLASCA